MKQTGTMILRGWIYTAELILLCLMLTGCSRRETSVFMEEAEPAMTESEKKISETEDAPSPAPSVIPAEIYVDVCGAVVNPGVYSLKADSRVFQAIEAAGGLSPEAAGECINRAQSLSDGEQIYVPTRAEAEEKQLFAGAAQTADNSGKDSSMVNLNTADEAELTTLTGIGQSRARDIIAYREANGGFGTIEDIMKVPGIKEGTFNKIKEHIVVK